MSRPRVCLLQPAAQTAKRPSRSTVRTGISAHRWLTSPGKLRSRSVCDRAIRRGRCAGKVLVVDFGLLGPLSVRDGVRQVAVSAPRQRVLLAALLLDADRVVSVDSL